MPTISVDLASVVQGGQVVVTGSGFTPNTTATLLIGIGGGVALSLGVSVDIDGSFVYPLMIGGNVPVGKRDIRVVDSSGVSSNTVWVTVSSAPAAVVAAPVVQAAPAVPSIFWIGVILVGLYLITRK